MDRLPVELLTLIFSFALPPHYTSTFSERASTLRALSLTCHHFRPPAQRLLFLTPIVLVQGPYRKKLAQCQSFRSSARQGAWKIDSLDVQWVAYQTMEPSRSNIINTLLQSKPLKNLSSLALKFVLFDPRLLLELGNLRTLALCEVQVGVEYDDSAVWGLELPQVEHLSLLRCSDSLELSQFPSVTAFAVEDNYDGLLSAVEYLLDYPSSRKLQYFSLPIDYFISSFSSDEWDDMMLKLPDFTLVDVRGFDFFESLPTEISVEHIYFNVQDDSANSLVTTAKDKWRDFWEADLEEVCPNLKTVVIPSRWQSLSEEQYTLITAFTERKKVELLLEEDYDFKGESERQLSRAFMKYTGLL